MAYDFEGQGKGRTAAQHPFNPAMVITPDKGNMQRATAAAMGYAVPAKTDLAQAVKAARIDEIADLPEAKGKARAALRLAMDYTAEAMPLARAKAFLRGAPTDAFLSTRAPQAASTTTTTKGEQSMPTERNGIPVNKAARRAELRNTMRGVQGLRVSATEPVDEPAPAPPPPPVDREARAVELRNAMRGVQGLPQS